MNFYERIMSSEWRRLSNTDKAQACSDYLRSIVPPLPMPQIHGEEANPLLPQMRTMLLDSASQFCFLTCSTVMKDLTEELESTYDMLKES